MTLIVEMYDCIDCIIIYRLWPHYRPKPQRFPLDTAFSEIASKSFIPPQKMY